MVAPTVVQDARKVLSTPSIIMDANGNSAPMVVLCGINPSTGLPVPLQCDSSGRLVFVAPS